MYKKVILLSLLFSLVIFGVDKMLIRDTSKGIPDPGPHIRQIFMLLKSEDVNGFKQLIVPKEVMKEMNESDVFDYMFANPNVAEFVMRLMFDNSARSDYDFYKEYKKESVSEFLDTRSEINKWKNAELLQITWKLTGDSKQPDKLRCNSKIYIKCGNQYYCIKYKNILYYRGQWYAGDFTEVENNTPFEYFPDMYLAPSVDGYIDRIPDPYQEIEPASEESAD